MNKYKCIKESGYWYSSESPLLNHKMPKIDEVFEYDRDGYIYIPQKEYEDPMEIEVVLFSDKRWTPKADFNECFKRIEDIREEKIDNILK